MPKQIKKVSNKMKKTIVMILALLMLLSLAACGQEEVSNAGEQMITQGSNMEQQTIQGNEATTESTQEEEVTTGAAAVSFQMFSYEGVELIPGEAFDADKLADAGSSFSAPSCAVEGSETVYNFGILDLTTFDEGKGEYIASVIIVDPNVTTPEGLALGDGMDKVVDCYGEGYAVNGTEISYTVDGVQLALIVDNDTVVQIEYRIAG